MNANLTIALTALNVAATLATAAMLAVARTERRDAEARIAESEKVCKNAAESAFNAYKMCSSEHIKMITGNLRGKLDKMKEEGEDDAAKIARIGTSSYAARADHVHPVCTDMGKATEETMTNGDSVSGVSAVSLDKTMWNIGGDSGVCDSYCSRVVISGTYRFFIFRERKFSKAGCLIYRGPEYVAFRAKHA